MLSTPFIMGNNMPMHYPYPYDMSQFPTARDHSVYPSYGAAGKFDGWLLSSNPMLMLIFPPLPNHQT